MKKEKVMWECNRLDQISFEESHSNKALITIDKSFAALMRLIHYEKKNFKTKKSSFFNQKEMIRKRITRLIPQPWGWWSHCQMPFRFRNHNNPGKLIWLKMWLYFFFEDKWTFLFRCSLLRSRWQFRGCEAALFNGGFYVKTGEALEESPCSLPTVILLLFFFIISFKQNHCELFNESFELHAKSWSAKNIQMEKGFNFWGQKTQMKRHSKFPRRYDI